MRAKVNVADSLAAVSDYFSPKIVGYVNDLKIEVVKFRGDFVWHSHPDTDDFFFVLDGQLTVQLEGETLS
jgi:mannose-6-phosphate isomerase-like protein (cupin superfamily)